MQSARLERERTDFLATQRLVLEIIHHFKLAPEIRASLQTKVIRAASAVAPSPSEQQIRDRIEELLNATDV
jgi:hypothetical protein